MFTVRREGGYLIPGVKRGGLIRKRGLIEMGGGGAYFKL